jgi:hypothetical protein
MGGRQSQEPAPAPMDISPRPTSGTTHRSSSSQHHSSPRHSSSPHSLHHDPPQSSSQDGSPQSRLPTLSNYPHMRPVARTHSQSASSRLQERHSLRTSPRTPAEQFLELNIALSTLQQRLQARAEARESSQSSLHPSSLPAGLPLLFFRPVPTLQCPVCSKDIPSSDMEAHMSQCMSRPRVTYNGESSVFHVCLTFLCSCFQLTLLHRTLESAVSALMTWYQVIHNILPFLWNLQLSLNSQRRRDCPASMPVYLPSQVCIY